MLVSHQHRFVFLHSRKTAGSAVTVTLLRYLGPGDEWLNAPAHGIMDDALHNGIVPSPIKTAEVTEAVTSAHGADLAHRALSAPHKLDRTERLAVAHAYNSQQPPPPPSGWQHVTAARARSYLGEPVWDSYFKFSFERNPWDRMASLYWWRMRSETRDGKPSVAFGDFIRAMHSGDRERMRANRAYLHSNWPIYTIGNQLAVDHLGKFENLADELHHVLDKVGIQFDGWLPQAKHRTRKSSLDELYDKETAQLVGEFFHREIALLGYEMPASIR